MRHCPRLHHQLLHLRQTTRHNAFTLVELMIVMAIIALLIALLMPALAKARKSAQYAMCLANNRQIGQYLTFYTTNHKGWLPDYTSAWDSSANGFVKIDRTPPASPQTVISKQAFAVSGYAAKLARMYQNIDIDVAHYFNQNTRALSIYSCPREYDVDPTRAELSYFPNFNETGGTTGSMGLFPYTFTGYMSNLNRYKYPSDYFLLAEMNHASNLPNVYYGNYAVYPYTNTAIRYRQWVWQRSMAHEGASNFSYSTYTYADPGKYGSSAILFADLHAALLPVDALALPSDIPSGHATTKNWNLNANAKIKLFIPPL